MTFELLCDRCGHRYKCVQLTTLCLRCAVGDDAAAHHGDWTRPLTRAELVAAASNCRNDIRDQRTDRWLWWPTGYDAPA